jgi:hypothetical protein
LERLPSQLRLGCKALASRWAQLSLQEVVMKRTARRLLGVGLGLVIAGGLGGTAANATHFTPWSAPINAEQVPGTDPSVNTEFNEGCPMQAPDGLSLFIASNRPGGLGGQDIWVSRRARRHGAFGPPANLGPPVNSSADDFCPTPLRDQRLLFVSARAGGCGGPDIYLTLDRGALGWSTPENLGCEVNSPFGEAGPSLVKTGRGTTLFFSSARPGGFSVDGASPPFDSDVYSSTTLANGSFGAAELVPGLNTAADDSRPNVRKDGREIVFDSNRPAGAPTAPTNDIYTATRARADGSWSSPLLLDAVSSPANDTRASLSRDGKTLYFGSNRPGGEGQSDVYVSTRQRAHGTHHNKHSQIYLAQAGSTVSLAEYLASISRPVRASVFFVRAVAASSNGWIVAGDPPLLRQVAAGCAKIGALATSRRLRSLSPPQRLRLKHLALVLAYSRVRAGAAETRRSARAAIAAHSRFAKTGGAEDEVAWHQAEIRTRQDLRQFMPVLGSFTQAVGTWRSAVVRYAATLNAPVPNWLRELR